jgi:site-specific DNA-methyltransferase (adenine-specific)
MIKRRAQPAIVGPPPTIIGDATLYWGDCLDIMPRLLSVSHIITDPPYSDRNHMLHATSKLRRTDGGAQRKPLTFDSIDAIRSQFLDTVYLINPGWLLAFCDIESVSDWKLPILSRGMKFKTTCIWYKPDATPKLNGQGPALAVEGITTTWCGKGHSRWNGGGMRGFFMHATNSPDKKGTTHPTQKPLSLMRELIKLFTNEGDTVLDPFMGSGSTGVACVEMGRKFIGIEQKGEYFQLAEKRIRDASSRGTLFASVPRYKRTPSMFAT